MTVLQDENKRLSFIFAEENEARIYDQMSFYRSGIERDISGIKAIDFLCVDEPRHLSYFIEVKDYGTLKNDASREHKKRQKAEDLALEVARKVLETIAGLWVASNWKECPSEEKSFSAKVLQNTVRVVLHYELPSDWTDADRKWRMADLKNKLAVLGWTNCLVVDGKNVDENFALASRNINGIDVLPTIGANVYDILRKDKLVLTKEAVECLKERLTW